MATYLYTVVHQKSFNNENYSQWYIVAIMIMKASRLNDLSLEDAQCVKCENPAIAYGKWRWTGQKNPQTIREN